MNAALALALGHADLGPVPTLRRTLDPDFLNDAANHPEVRPWLGGKGPLDLSAIVANPANVALESEGGGYVLVKQGSGQYEAHTLFLPEGRRHAYALAVRGFRYLFTATDCLKVVTKVPAGNVAAAAHAKRCGFAEVFSRDAAWPGVVGPEPVSYQTLTLDAWIARDAEALAKGHWFHEQLEAAKVEAGSIREIHADDPAHDRAVGAAVLMLQAGNPAKAVWHYNLWAAHAGYAPITLVSASPVVVDVADAVVEVTREGMEVLLCR